MSRSSRPLRRRGGGGGTPLWPARRVCVCVETLQRGVGVEVCPAEPPLDLES